MDIIQQAHCPFCGTLTKSFGKFVDQFICENKECGAIFFVDTDNENNQLEKLIMPKIAEVIDKARIDRIAWEDDEDIILYNNIPIGGTISRRSRLELDRWFDSFKEHLKTDIEKMLNSNF